jgi:hypothetical protein
LSKQLGRQINSVDDLVVEKEPELPSELQQILDWHKSTGLPISAWSEYTRDFSKMSDEAVAREILAKSYPTFDAEDIDFKMKDFIYNEETDDEDQRMEKRVALKQFAADGRRELEKNRLDLKPSEPTALSAEDQEKLQKYDQIVQNQQQVQADNTAYTQALTSAATSFKPLNLNLGEGMELKYDVDAKSRRELPGLVEKMPHWYNQDGTVNHEAILRDALIIRDFDKIVARVLEQGVNIGKEGKMKADNNTDLDPGAPPVQGGGDEGKSKTNIDSVVDNLVGTRKRGLKWKPSAKAEAN